MSETHGGGASSSYPYRGPADEHDGQALRRLGVDFYRVNLLAAFGAEWSLDQVETAAAAALLSRIWGNRELELRVPEVAAGFPHDDCRTLEGWDSTPLGAALASGRGAILCTFHLGGYRFIPFDLMLQGLRVTQLVDAVGRDHTAALAATLPETLRSRITLVNVEGGATAMTPAVKALRRGEVVMVYIDGNTGSDSRWGEAGKTEIDFLGHRVRVKNGVVRLAARLGVPVVPVVAPRDAEWRARVEIGDAIDPGGRLDGEAQERFVAATLQSLYDCFGRYARASPEQWEGAGFVHRWRVPPATPAVAFDAVPDFRLAATGAYLHEGGRYAMARGRVVDSGFGEDVVWIDAATLRSFKAPPEARSLFVRLASPAGAGGAGMPPYELRTLAWLEANGCILPLAARAAA